MVRPRRDTIVASFLGLGGFCRLRLHRDPLPGSPGRRRPDAAGRARARAAALSSLRGRRSSWALGRGLRRLVTRTACSRPGAPRQKQIHSLCGLLNLRKAVHDPVYRWAEQAGGGEGGVKEHRALRLPHIREREPEMPLCDSQRGHAPSNGLGSGFRGAKGEVRRAPQIRDGSRLRALLIQITEEVSLEDLQYGHRVECRSSLSGGGESAADEG